MAKNRQTYIDPKSIFEATGRGYFNRLPNFQATSTNANAVLINKKLVDLQPADRHPIFCVGVHTGWTVQGSYGQGANSRYFYPRSLMQDELLIRCAVASQFEYDRLVHFLHTHHVRALNDKKRGIPLEFKLFGKQVETGIKGVRALRTLHDGMHYSGFATAIQAGHERFINAPVMEIVMKVSEDFLNVNVVQEGLLNTELQKRFLSQAAPNLYKPPIETPPESVADNPRSDLEDAVDIIDSAWDSVTNLFGNNDFEDGSSGGGGGSW